MIREITYEGEPLTLVGRALKIYAPAPDFRVTSQDLKEVRLGDFKRKIKILTSFPSLDTPVCDRQVKEFNKTALDLSKDIVIIGVSKDLPFAQRRFCESFNIKNIQVLSDYRTSSFGINYGLLIKELNLLARAVVLIDRNDVVRYVQVVEELTSSPDYPEALAHLNEVVKDSLGASREQMAARCKSCEGGVLPLPKEAVKEFLEIHRDWRLGDKEIMKDFKFRDFFEAKSFVDLISIIAEEQNHHPQIKLSYNKVQVLLTTHAAGGLTENDLILAGMIDELMERG